MIHLIYCSATSRELSTKELEEILEQSRANNAKAGLTGMLLYEDGAFFQVLEGEAEAVETLYGKIEQDERHTRVMKLIAEPIEEREFGEWTMGYPKVTRQDLQEIPGLNDFFAEGRSFLDLEPGRARTLMAAFKKGKWRG